MYSMMASLMRLSAFDLNTHHSLEYDIFRSMYNIFKEK
jgi:hypothetical protein